MTDTPTFHAAMKKRRRPVPADFGEVAPALSLEKLTKHYKAGTSTIQRWRVEVGLRPLAPGHFSNRPVPDDFGIVGPTMSQNAAQRHYGACADTVRKWYAATGTRPSGKRRNSRTVNWGARQPVNFGHTGDGSIAQAAANHLRRLGYANIYRATVLDRAARVDLPDEGKHHYFVSGRGLMHQDEMIAMAEARGFGMAA